MSDSIIIKNSITRGNITWEGNIPPSAELLKELEYFGKTYFDNEHVKLVVHVGVKPKK